MNGREMFRQTSAKQTNSQTQGNQIIKSANRRSPPKQHKRVQGTTTKTPRSTSIKKTTLYSTYGSRKNLDSFSLPITVRVMPNIKCKTTSTFENKILRIDRRSSRPLEYAEGGHFTLLFCEESKRNEQRIMVSFLLTH